MRVVYGVHGYGRGHATRSAAVLAELSKRHDVLVMAGGDAYDILKPDFEVFAVPSFGFAYTKRGHEPSFFGTFLKSLPLLFDIAFNGEQFRRVVQKIREFEAEIIISDAEAFTHHAARSLELPHVSFDHFGVMVHFEVSLRPWDRLRRLWDASVYRLIQANPQRALLSSFYTAPLRSAHVRIIPTLLRDEVLRHSPKQGEHILVYLNNGAQQLTDRLLGELIAADIHMVVYGTNLAGNRAKLVFQPAGNASFLRDLASCRAVLTTAGNQLVGEALHYGKPLLVMPEGCVEQRMNARGLVRMRAGDSCEMYELTANRLHDFLRDVPRFSRNIQTLLDQRGGTIDGRTEAVSTIEGWMFELTGTCRSELMQVQVKSKAATGGS